MVVSYKTGEMSLNDESDDDLEDDLEDDHVDAENTPPENTPPEPTVIGLNVCCVCYDQPSAVLLIPCGHLKVCCECWDNIVATHEEKMEKFLTRMMDEPFRPQLKCPSCNTVVTSHLDKIYT